MSVGGYLPPASGRRGRLSCSGRRSAGWRAGGRELRPPPASGRRGLVDLVVSPSARRGPEDLLVSPSARRDRAESARAPLRESGLGPDLACPGAPRLGVRRGSTSTCRVRGAGRAASSDRARRASDHSPPRPSGRGPLAGPSPRPRSDLRGELPCVRRSAPRPGRSSRDARGGRGRAPAARPAPRPGAPRLGGVGLASRSVTGRPLRGPSGLRGRPDAASFGTRRVYREQSGTLSGGWDRRANTPQPRLLSTTLWAKCAISAKIVAES